MAAGDKFLIDNDVTDNILLDNDLTDVLQIEFGVAVAAGRILRNNPMMVTLGKMMNR